MRDDEVADFLDNYGLIAFTYENIPIKELGDHYLTNDEVLLLWDRAKSQEMVIVQTCNRIEIYLYSTDLRNVTNNVLEFLKAIHRDDVTSKAKVLKGREVVLHLFRLASGLESLSLGEYEILGQVRESLDKAEKLGTLGDNLKLLFERGIKTGRLVRNRTSISKGKTGVYSLALEYALNRVDLASSKIAVVGAGQISSKVLQLLTSNGIYDVTLFNRTPERAQELSGRFGVKWEPLDLERIRLFDVIFSAISYPNRLKLEGPKLIIDLSVPPVFEGQNVVDLDELRRISSINAQRKRGEILNAEKLVLEELERFSSEYLRVIYNRLVSAFMSRMEQIRKREMERALRELAKSGKVDDKTVEVLNAMTRSILKKSMEPVLSEIKKRIREGKINSAEELIQALGGPSGVFPSIKAEEAEIEPTSKGFSLGDRSEG
jgi:glutamyl-tRNA reductase